jgi:hypothetical protein
MALPTDAPASDAKLLLAKIRAESDTTERIERAAIRLAGRVYATNSLDHDDVARAMFLHGLRGVVGPEERGFITSAGRFVRDAAGLA